MPLAVRIGLFHAAIYIGTGVSSPYMPVWFRAQHLSGTAIGVLISAPMLVRIFSGPVLAVWADGFALRRADNAHHAQPYHNRATCPTARPPPRPRRQ